jgi:hypothetical protein
VRILLVNGPALISKKRNAQMSTDRYKAMAREHIQKWCPDTWRQWKQEDTLDENLQGMANQAQAEYEPLLKVGYRDHEADEVARQLVQPRPEVDGLDAEQRAEPGKWSASIGNTRRFRWDNRRSAQHSGAEFPHHRRG